jgi:hypothetical protein
MWDTRRRESFRGFAPFRGTRDLGRCFGRVSLAREDPCKTRTFGANFRGCQRNLALTGRERNFDTNFWLPEGFSKASPVATRVRAVPATQRHFK